MQKKLSLRKISIKRFVSWLLFFGKKNGKTPVESSEDIEIIRFLEMGIKVKMVEVDGGTLAVDYPEDVKMVEKIFRKQQLYSKLDDKVKSGIR